ncbi:hypothetical protein EDD86DRAFT_220148 [Gorgonomyces haynaldii]|nr:hypothetical protein EDD86DRAFT_220148 [Gorgonomyces haynaldii]
MMVDNPTLDQQNQSMLLYESVSIFTEDLDLLNKKQELSRHPSDAKFHKIEFATESRFILRDTDDIQVRDHKVRGLRPMSAVHKKMHFETASYERTDTPQMVQMKLTQTGMKIRKSIADGFKAKKPEPVVYQPQPVAQSKKRKQMNLDEFFRKETGF